MAEIILTREGLSYGETVVTNFTVSAVTPLFDVQNLESMVAIELNVHAPDRIYPVTADIHRPILKQLLEAVPSCRLLNKNAAEFLDAYLIEQATCAGGNRILCRDFGLQRMYTGNWIFAAGDEILGDCGTADVVVHPSVAKVRLSWDRDGDRRKAVVRTLYAMQNNRKTVWPTFMYTLLSSLRSQISKLGITTFPVLYLVGQQNSGKSWLVEHFSLLYDDMTEGVLYGNLDAGSTDIGVIHAASGYTDTVVAVDDLPKSGSPAVQRARMEVMEKSIRFISNGSTRVTASKNAAGVSIRCLTGAVCTGEIPLTTASMLTRLLVVLLTGHKKTGNMSDRADAATTFRWWMLWLLPRLDAELEVLKKLLVDTLGGDNARLEATNILFRWVAELFYRFALEDDFIEDIYYREAVELAEEVLSSLLKAQAEDVSRIQDKAPRGNLSFYILKGYREGAFHIVSDRKKLKHDSDCLVEKDALCVRTKTLLSQLHRWPCFRALTENKMNKTLRREWEAALGSDALPEYAEARSAAKRIHKHRYLEIPFDVLNAAARKY